MDNRLLKFFNRPNKPLPPQRLLVVGATSAIAQAALRLWAMPGAAFILVGRDAEKLTAVAADCTTRGAQTQVIVLPNAQGLAAFIGPLLTEVFAAGKLDGALIAHGHLPAQTEVENDPAAIVEQTMVNGLSGAIWLALLAPHFAAQRGGWLAAITSVAANRGRAKMYVYGAAKALLAHYLSGLRQRLSSSGVRVIDLRPGPIATPMTAGLGNLPLLTTTAAIAPRLVKACGNGNHGANRTIYLPGIWLFIMSLLDNLPEFLWVKLKI